MKFRSIYYTKYDSSTRGYDIGDILCYLRAYKL